MFPVPIGDYGRRGATGEVEEEVRQWLPPVNGGLLAGCRTFVVEEERSARRFLRRAGYHHPLEETVFFTLNEHTTPEEIGGYLDALERGENVGLLSEAGLPCVADPGAMIVAVAQRRGFEVVPLVGPSSLMLALMASGLNGQQFAFNGYLPVDKGQRASAIRRLEERAHREHQTQLFIEAPYRNNQMLEALCAVLQPNTMVCVATDITLPTQTIRTMPSAKWKKERANVDLHKHNTVFLIG